MIHRGCCFYLYFIRHGESVSNLRPDIIMGRSPNSKLTRTGQRQARALGRRFKKDGIAFDAIHVSPIVRARQTAFLMMKAMNCKAPLSPDDRLMELTEGLWEGSNRDTAWVDPVLLQMNEKCPDFVPPEGESLRMTELRAAQWLMDAILINPRYTVQKESPLHLAIVSHGITTKCLIRHILNSEAKFAWRQDIDHTSVSLFRFDDRGWWPKYINCTAHLRSFR